MGQAWFSFDQPSDHFAIFGVDAIMAPGGELDGSSRLCRRRSNVDVPSSLDRTDMDQPAGISHCAAPSTTPTV